MLKLKEIKISDLTKDKIKKDKIYLVPAEQRDPSREFSVAYNDQLFYFDPDAENWEWFYKDYLVLVDDFDREYSSSSSSDIRNQIVNFLRCYFNPDSPVYIFSP